MAAKLDKNIQNHRLDSGLGEIQTDQGLQILEQVLLQDYLQIGVASVNWTNYSKQFTQDNIPPFFSIVVGKEKTQQQVDKSQSQVSNLLDSIVISSSLTDSYCRLSERFLKTLR